MRTEQLKYLVDVAETKSMSKTAERMFVSPQAVSQSIKQLETELDIELFVRNSQGVSLTKLGEGVVEKAKTMLREEQAMSQMIAESKEKSVDDSTLQIRICSTSAVPNMVLPSVLADMKHKGVDVVPRISMVDSLQELLDDVQSGTYDVGLITYNAEALFRQFAKYQVELDMNLLAEDELVVVMDKRLHQPGQSVLSGEEYQKHFRTMYSMTPVKAMEAGKNVKVEGKENNLIDLIKMDETFKPVWDHLDEILDAKKFIGRAPSQTVEFIANEIDPILEKHASLLGETGDVRV